MPNAAPLNPGFPNDLPEGWWERSSDEVQALLRGVTWRRRDNPQRRQAETMERLLRHHPSLLPLALEQGLELDLRWPEAPDGHSALWHALHLSTPSAIQALRQRWATLDDREIALSGPLAMTMLHLSRNPSSDSPLAALSPRARVERERELLEQFTAVGQGLNENGLHANVAVRAAKIGDGGLPATTLNALIEHGVDLNARGDLLFNAALYQLLVRGEPQQLDRWLRQGLTISNGPGDDRAALDVMVYALKRTSETAHAWAQRQAKVLDTLAQHGWTPGPRFREQALGVATRHGTDPMLLDMLIERGAFVEGRDKMGRTALHHASHDPSGLINVVALLERGVDPMVKDHDGQTAMDALRDNAQAYPGASDQFGAALVAMETMALRQAVRSTDPKESKGLNDLTDPKTSSPPARGPRARL